MHRPAVDVFPRQQEPRAGRVAWRGAVVTAEDDVSSERIIRKRMTGAILSCVNSCNAALGVR